MVKFFFDRLNLSNKVHSRKFLFRSKCKRRFYFLSHRVTWLVLRETDDSSNIHDSWWFIVVPKILPILLKFYFFSVFKKLLWEIWFLTFWHRDEKSKLDSKQKKKTKRKKLFLEFWNLGTHFCVAWKFTRITGCVGLTVFLGVDIFKSAGKVYFT